MYAVRATHVISLMAYLMIGLITGNTQVKMLIKNITLSDISSLYLRGLRGNGISALPAYTTSQLSVNVMNSPDA